MRKELCAPQIDNCIRRLWHACDAGSMVQPAYSEQTRADLDRLFSMLRQIKPTGENGVREFWLHAPRGSLADYGDYEEYLEDGAVDSEEEFEALWRADYPQETVWYHFAATEDAAYGFRMVSVGRRLVFIEQESREKGFPLDGTALSGWLVQAVAEVLQQVKAGVYNAFVEENLPAEHRVGTISRAAYWQIWPESKTASNMRRKTPKRCPAALRSSRQTTFSAFARSGIGQTATTAQRNRPKNNIASMRTGGTTACARSTGIRRRILTPGITTGRAVPAIRGRFAAAATRRTSACM